ncbi:DUF2059 domain-containing protein [Arsenicitalea aurantiaca]|uniref:DUF2059 domain-containing protein n=1 Tax=Arsenicitalea aurantiaca TaxID=1783274 RepID=A0A433XJX0_9HYPH|nr:DUF2059 domain-containing protein [Arsenicitalea aurantiaca]RUT34389.1 DUF2059 domain-containing protein [Arsenicitalea aurantiaca]
MPRPAKAAPVLSIACRAILAGAVFLLPVTSPALGQSAPALTDRPALSEEATNRVADLMATTGLDRIFEQFGTAVAESPALDAILADEAFVAAWQQSAREAFEDEALVARLEGRLTEYLSQDELDQLVQFLSSPFGQRVNGLELATQDQPPEAQERLMLEGEALYADAGSQRQEHFERMLTLTSAEISNAMLAGSIRAMMLGLHFSNGGDIAVPWEEIDEEVEATMQAMAGELDASLRFVLAYTYRELTDAELEQYIAFLETPAAQRFYALTAFSVGEIVHEAMEAFGTSLALRLNTVAV